ncbi:M17 family metallopeptidase [[Mycoplasma] gypis]|uniref:Probable cytosol aminopeptidase n=1 Tax=[Mycoplasma] gypis TaxID=92404 RepID=A0ABZ2RNA4_9BACT|nr:leucyl aminopeptidase family protein [[Mycoplasma] gypis]MBN0919339.1 leucyl aminopeptidase family protein [[Mycoplasma] gypis]
MLKEYANYKSTKQPTLYAVYKGQEVEDFVVRKKHHITEDLVNNKRYFYVDEIKTYYQLTVAVDSLLDKIVESIQVDIQSFINDYITFEDVLRAFHLRYALKFAKIYNEKSEKDEEKLPKIKLFHEDTKYRKYSKYLVNLVENITAVRDLQITPPNVCNSEWLADFIEKDFRSLRCLEVNVLGSKEINEYGMGLMTSVNRGSTYQPRVVVINYTPKKNNKKRITLVGKGITFDTGGVNTKGYFMEGMKYDMSGSAIVAYVLKTIAQQKLNINVSAIMMITDNRTNGDPSLPESVYKSMSGKTVEVVDTDAEGRLVLADGITYAKDVLKSSTIIDVATLTGTIVKALGSVYSGIYSTSDKEWELFEQASQKSKEKVWRMPMHEDFHKFNKESKVADLNNYSNNELSDCNTAAMFLKEFAGDVDFIHCDVAGTADRNLVPQGELLYTLVEYIKLKVGR